MVALLILLIATATGIERTVDPDLTAIAERRVIEVQADWSHNGKPAGVAEVLAFNVGSLDPAATALAQWRDSPEHWAILTEPAYTRIGCATALVETTTYCVCILSWGSDEPQPPAGSPTLPSLLPNADQGASSATSGTVPAEPNPPPHVLMLAGAFMLGALALLFVLRALRR